MARRAWRGPIAAGLLFSLQNKHLGEDGELVNRLYKWLAPYKLGRCTGTKSVWRWFLATGRRMPIDCGNFCARTWCCMGSANRAAAAPQAWRLARSTRRWISRLVGKWVEICTCLSVKTRPIAHHRRICVLAASASSGPVQSNFAAAIRLDVGPPSPPMLTAPTTQAQGPNPAPLTPIPHPLATHFAAISRFSSRPFLACKKSAFRIA